MWRRGLARNSLIVYNLYMMNTLKTALISVLVYFFLETTPAAFSFGVNLYTRIVSSDVLDVIIRTVEPKPTPSPVDYE